MSHKPAEKTQAQTQTQPSLTDPIYKGSSITLDYDTTVKNLCLALHSTFDYHPKTFRLKGFDFDAASYPNTRSALDKLHKSLAAFENGTDKAVNQFYLVLFNVKSLVEESRKDDGTFTKNKLTPYAEDFVRKNDAHIILYALEHLDRTNKKLMAEIQRLEKSLSASERSRENFVREKNKLEATIVKYGNQSMNESQLNIDKGTFGHELMKLKAVVSKFKLNVIYHIQLALNDLAKVEETNVRVFGFLADLQSILLKDIRHNRNTSLFLNGVVNNLTYGLQLLLNEKAGNETLSEDQKLIITQLYDQLVNIEIKLPIQELFAKAKTSDEVVNGILDVILKRWNTLVSDIGQFSPQELHLLSTTIDEVNKATLLVAKEDHRPRMLELEKAPTPGEFLKTLFQVVISIYQIHFDKTFFAIEGTIEWDQLRDESTAYFNQLREFLVKVSKFMQSAKEKVELSAIEGYLPEYDEILKDVYDKIWEDRAQKVLNKSAGLNASFDKGDSNKSHVERVSMAPRDLKRPPASVKKRPAGAVVAKSKGAEHKGVEKKPEPTQLKQDADSSVVVNDKRELQAVSDLDMARTTQAFPAVTELKPEIQEISDAGGKENIQDDGGTNALFL